MAKSNIKLTPETDPIAPETLVKLKEQCWKVEYQLSDVLNSLVAAKFLIEEHGDSQEMLNGVASILTVLTEWMGANENAGDLELGLRAPFDRLLELEILNAQ